MNRLRQYVVEYRPIGLCAGGLMWLIWIVSSALGTGNLDRNGQVIGTDHTAFHTAALLLLEGRGDALFDYPHLQAFRAEQERITGSPGFSDPYRNPPFYALPYESTARLPYLLSFALWAGIGLLALVAGLYLIRGRKIFWPLLWSLSFYPVFAVVSFGQNTLLSVGIFGLVYRCLVSERRFFAGLAAGFLLFKPQLLMGLGVWWLLSWRKYWPSLLGICVTAGFFAGLSLWLLPDESRTWVQRLPDIARYDAFEFFNLHNSRGFGDLLTGNREIGIYVGLAGLMLSLVWFTGFWARHRQDATLMFAAALLTTLWGSPHTMTYEWALAILPAILLWDHRPLRRGTWLLIFAICWAALFLSTPLAKAQLTLMGVAIQLSVPCLALAIWRIGRELRQ
ncbi:MAG: DUF2029 domain-containing protein [Gemmataceae bacterium]|nr:DUF2029 domain-containing protein [Gemmataceae bacterium]